MKRSSSLQKGEFSVQLKNAGHEVLYVEKPSQDLPKEIVHVGERYFRFIDFIYIPVPTEVLTEKQLTIINTLRDNFFNKLPTPDINQKVRKKIRDAINRIHIQSVLELGPGKNPLFRNDHKRFKTYYQADLSHEVVNENKKNGFECFYFGKESDLLISASSIDLIVAIFVLQFHISSYQIKELNRVLKMTGTIIANVYRRQPESRSQLQSKFSRAGFNLKILPDRDKLCRNHEYWFVFKGEPSKNVSGLIRLFDTN